MLVLCGRRELRLHLLCSGSPIAYAAGWAALDSAPPMSPQKVPEERFVKNVGLVDGEGPISFVLSNSLENPFVPPEEVGHLQETVYEIDDLVSHRLSGVRPGMPFAEAQKIVKGAFAHAKRPKYH